MQCSRVDGRGPYVVDSCRALPRSFLVAAATNAIRVCLFVLHAHKLLYQLGQISKILAIRLGQTDRALPFVVLQLSYRLIEEVTNFYTAPIDQVACWETRRVETVI